jgi:hypothetical protein
MRRARQSRTSGEIQARHALDLVEPIGNGFLVSSRALAAAC